MDVKRINDIEPDVSFDILRTWLGDAFHRKTGEIATGGCGWRALARALAQPPEISLSCEQALRRCLVNTYRQQQPEVLDEVLCAKLADPLSFFSLAGYREREGGGLDEARSHWPWYLYSLTFDTADFLPGHAANVASAGGFQEPTQKEVWSLDMEPPVLLPLDFVDIQVLAKTCNVQIIVSRLLDMALRFEAKSSAVSPRWAHLLLHESSWSPLLDARLPDEGPRNLVGSMVELRCLTDRLSKAVDWPAAFVLRYDTGFEAHVALVDGGAELHMERAHFGKILYNPSSDAGDDPSLGKRRLTHPVVAAWHTAPPTWRGGSPLPTIPDESVEFMLLHDLVRTMARSRLHTLLRGLSGRRALRSDGSSAGVARRYTSLPAGRPNHQSSWSGPFVWHAVTRAPLRRVPLEYALNPEEPLVVVAPCAWLPRAEGQMALSVGQKVHLRQVSDNGDWILCSRCCKAHHDAPTAGRGWCPRDCLTIWEVVKAFSRAKCKEMADRYLPLSVGDALVVSVRYDGLWQGWAFGVQWGGRDEKRGLFRLSNTQPRVLVSSVAGVPEHRSQAVRW